jgi:cytochrome oxidase Cu insertion factor (SCO1/SenC/PrrC family)
MRIRSFKILASVLLVTAVSVFPAAGQAAGPDDEIGFGAKVGVAVPHPLTLRDQTGKAREFADLTGKRGLILLFTRSLDW